MLINGLGLVVCSLWFVVGCLIGVGVFSLQFTVGCLIAVAVLWFFITVNNKPQTTNCLPAPATLYRPGIRRRFKTENRRPQTVNCLSASCHCCCHFEHAYLYQALHNHKPQTTNHKLCSCHCRCYFEHTNIRQTLRNHKQPNPYLCPVKLVSILLASYILVLSCLPCSDSRECNINSPTTITKASGNHQDHQHEDEACSMFCSCACCGQIFVPHFQPMLIELSDTPHARKELFAYHNDRLPADFYGNIWQPPKLS